MANKLLLAGLALLAGLVLLVQWRATARETRAEATHPPVGELIEIDGVTVHAAVRGEGPDVVLLHGASGNLRDMTFSLAPRLAGNYRVIAFDRPGLGYTDRLGDDAASLRAQADLLSRAAARLGADKPIVMGQSYGGAVALAWAVHFPDRLSALVPVSAVSNPWESDLSLFYRITSSRLGSLLAVPVLTAFVSQNRIESVLEDIFAPQEPPEGYGDHIGTGLTLRRVSLRANADQRAALLDEIRALHTEYGRIDVPTEIVHGTADTTVGLSIHSEKLVDQIEGATLARLPGIGHMPQHAAQDLVAAAIDRAARRAGLR